MEELKEIFTDLFELIQELIWMHNFDSTSNVQDRLKQLSRLRKKAFKLNIFK